MEDNTKTIVLDFGSFKLNAELLPNKIAEKFYENLPYDVNLISWGAELYGSIEKDLGQENPVPDIPEGGLAYTSRGNYFCVFFGQTPAWPVEYIGRITDNWDKLRNPGITKVSIKFTK